MAESSAKWIVDVQEDDFEREVMERSRELPVIVDFWAPWCGPCRILAPVLEKIVQEHGGKVILAKVNTDEAQRLAVSFGILSIPVIVGFLDGQPRQQLVGVRPEAELREFVDQLLPSAADILQREADAVATGDPDRAETLYREALEQEDRHVKALLGLAETLAGRDDPGAQAEARDIIERLGLVGDEDKERFEALQSRLFFLARGNELGGEEAARTRLEAAPEDGERKYELGCAVAAAERYREALQLLLEAAQADKTLAREKVRDAMVKIFHLVGNRSELADEYREKLTRALY